MVNEDSERERRDDTGTKVANLQNNNFKRCVPFENEFLKRIIGKISIHCFEEGRMV